MSTDGAKNGTRWLPRLLGVLLLLMGLALLAGGIKLSQLGGSLYYLIAGIGFALSGILLLAMRRIALGLYGLVLLGSTIWALWEVGLDWWQLVPRLAIWFAVGVVLLLPWARRPLIGPSSKINTALLSVAVVAAGASALGSQFTHPGETFGTLNRDNSEMGSAAPTCRTANGRPTAVQNTATATRRCARSPRRMPTDWKKPGASAPVTYRPMTIR